MEDADAAMGSADDGATELCSVRFAIVYDSVLAGVCFSGIFVLLFNAARWNFYFPEVCICLLIASSLLCLHGIHKLSGDAGGHNLK